MRSFNMTKNFNDCVILFGGSSEERLVSVASAQNISVVIPEAPLWFWTKDGKIHEVTSAELGAHAEAFTKEFSPKSPVKASTLEEALKVNTGKTIIIALHGTEGEDGTLQRMLERMKITFTGTGAAASEKAFNKAMTKAIARDNNLSVAPELVVENVEPANVKKLEHFLEQNKKIVLKPLANGSSVGLHIIASKADLEKALPAIKASGYLPYVSEPFITGREITVGVREDKDHKLSPLPCSEVRVIQGRQFDYQGKYLGSGVEELTPAPLTKEESDACQKLALAIHKAIGCKGYSRTDMILTEKGPVMLEINTLPGLSKASFIPQQLKVAGMTLRDFFLEQINL
nr:D-ala D-ala ligase C-terminus [uncultured bacterium]